MRWPGVIASLLAAAALAEAACAQEPPPRGPAAHDAPAPTQRAAVRVVAVAEGFEHPWALAFLPDGFDPKWRMLVTERPGRMRYVAGDGALSAPLKGLPAVKTGGQAGLFDLALAPDFAQSRRIYFSYLAEAPGGAAVTVATATLGADALSGVRVIFQAKPVIPGTTNLGSRIVFARSGNLFVTVGDRFNRAGDAQKLESDLGKVLRLKPDGSIPADNPFMARAGARSEIWSYGHRNPQAAAIHPQTGELWTVEHGPRGGDEVNVTRAGRNYGWPAITYGVDYSGRRVSDKAAAPSMEQPLYYWDPSPAPSGMAFYTGDKIPAWRGDLFVGALAGQALIRLRLQDGKVVGEERLLHESLGERIRDVRQGPDGYLYLVTDEAEGRILRVVPAR
ncbi:MAG: PQQ-dependent sugar dehydrogenase [Hyphomonadaceae bacterium]